ncbi:MAG: hypothetical protein U9Q71_09545, partial [Pseudomonadota bacterium]|nr:hypothetical protein [Pseudomonadota bacterium]
MLNHYYNLNCKLTKTKYVHAHSILAACTGVIFLPTCRAVLLLGAAFLLAGCSVVAWAQQSTEHGEATRVGAAGLGIRRGLRNPPQ